LSDDDIQALVIARWNEFLVEEIILAQDNDALGREADDIGQLQLAIHKLERARLEVAYYSDAITKVANTMRMARRPVTGESCSPTTNGILISHRWELCQSQPRHP